MWRAINGEESGGGCIVKKVLLLFQQQSKQRRHTATVSKALRVEAHTWNTSDFKLHVSENKNKNFIFYSWKCKQMWRDFNTNENGWVVCFAVESKLEIPVNFTLSFKICSTRNRNIFTAQKRSFSMIRNKLLPLASVTFCGVWCEFKFN